MYVYFKRGDQGEEIGDLHRKFQRQNGRAPDWRAPTFTRAISGLTCADIDPGQREHYWWEDCLRQQGWLGMELHVWELAWKAIDKHGAEALVRNFPEADA
jgi:hypothetical protein